MTAWYEGALVGFDLETTGVDPFSDHIIQIGLDFSIMKDGEQTPVGSMSHESLVYPGVKITNSDIHGITDEVMSSRRRISEKPAVEDLALYLRAMVLTDVPIVIFNAPFDWTFLRAKMDLFGLEWDLDDARIIDPLVCDRHFDKWRKGKGMRKQGKVAGIYGLPENLEAHTARADAAECVAIARAMARKYPAMQSGSDLSQELWARRQQMELQKYFDDSGRKNDDGSRIEIEMGWPLRDSPGWDLVPVAEALASNTYPVREIKDTM